MSKTTNSICIFCVTPLGKKTTPEHILLNCFGGKWEVRDAICSECNNKFGGTIDKAFGEQTAHFRNLLQIKSGRNSPPPSVQSKTTRGGRLKIASDGAIHTNQKPFTIIETENGTKNLQVTTQSWEQIERQLPNMAKATNISEETLREKFSETEATVVNRRPDPIMVSPSFGGPEAMRAAAKACLVLWSRAVGNDECRSKAYDEVRNFILNGDKDFLEKKSELDGRILNINDKITKEFGPAFNFIYVKSDNYGKVIGHFTVINLTGFQIILSDAGGSPNVDIGYVNDPLTCKDSRQAHKKFEISSAWLANPEYDHGAVNLQKRLAPIMGHYQKIGMDREILRIMHDVFKNQGIEEGDIITDEAVKELSHRLSYHFVGVPYTQKIDRDAMRKRFGKP